MTYLESLLRELTWLTYLESLLIELTYLESLHGYMVTDLEKCKLG